MSAGESNCDNWLRGMDSLCEKLGRQRQLAEILVPLRHLGSYGFKGELEDSIANYIQSCGSLRSRVGLGNFWRQNLLTALDSVVWGATKARGSNIFLLAELLRRVLDLSRTTLTWPNNEQRRHLHFTHALFGCNNFNIGCYLLASDAAVQFSPFPTDLRVNLTIISWSSCSCKAILI